MKQFLLGRFIIHSLRWLGYSLLLFGLIFLVTGICEVQHPSENSYNLTTKCVVVIAIGLACFLSSFFVHGFNIIVQAAAAYLDKKNMEVIEKRTGEKET